MKADWGQIVKKIEAATKDEVRILKPLLDTVNSKICPDCKECCCAAHVFDRGCAKSGGYYDARWGDPTPPALIKYLKKKYKFTIKTGFLNPETGCKLPRYLRSYTCLRYFCGKEQKLLRDLDIQMAVYLVNRIRTIKEPILSETCNEI